MIHKHSIAMVDDSVLIQIKIAVFPAGVTHAPRLIQVNPRGDTTPSIKYKRWMKPRGEEGGALKGIT